MFVEQYFNVMINLSKAEEQVMLYLWKLKKAYMKDIIECYAAPKPAMTTIATLLKRMQDKGYINYTTDGKSREYYPLIKEQEYISTHVEGIVERFFGDSASQFASFFTRSSDMTKEELESLKKIIDKEIEKK